MCRPLAENAVDSFSHLREFKLPKILNQQDVEYVSSPTCGKGTRAGVNLLCNLIGQMDTADW